MWYMRSTFFEKKALLHLVFCVLVLAVLGLGMYLLYVLGFRFRDLPSAFSDCLFFLLCIYTGRELCNRWYLKGQLLLFLSYTILASLVLALLKWLIVKYVFNHPLVGFFELSRDVMPFFLIGVAIGMLLKMIRAATQTALDEERLRAEQKTMEFNMLQSQLSPHFLFNVLNNLYGISIAEHQRIPPLLLKLSQLLRYSVYGGKQPFVPLKEELTYIQTYIDFEQIRISDRLVLEMVIDEAIDPDILIAPSVLIVFIENAFKHSKNTLDEKIFISITLRIIAGKIIFKVVNSYNAEVAPQHVNESSGLGLTNTLKRLKLLYGDDFVLKQYAAEGNYYVDLQLKIKEGPDDQLPYRR